MLVTKCLYLLNYLTDFCVSLFIVSQTCFKIFYLKHKHQRTDFLHLGLVTILGFLFLSLSSVGHFHSLFVHFLYNPCFLILLFLGMHCTEGVPSEVMSTSLPSLSHAVHLLSITGHTQKSIAEELTRWPRLTVCSPRLPCLQFLLSLLFQSSLPFNHYLEVVDLCST